MKTTTYLLRLSPEKKRAWMERAKAEGLSLAKWIESRCDRLSEMAEDAVKEHREGRTVEFPKIHALNCPCDRCRG